MWMSDVIMLKIDMNLTHFPRTSNWLSSLGINLWIHHSCLEKQMEPCPKVRQNMSSIIESIIILWSNMWKWQIESFGALVKNLMKSAVVACSRAEREYQYFKSLNLPYYVLIHFGWLLLKKVVIDPWYDFKL